MGGASQISIPQIINPYRRKSTNTNSNYTINFNFNQISKVLIDSQFAIYPQPLTCSQSSAECVAKKVSFLALTMGRDR